MTNILIKIIIISASAYIVICMMVHVFEYMTLYHPGRTLKEPLNPFLNYNDYQVQTADGETVNLWYFSHPAAKWTALLCHGNAGNNSHRMEQITALYQKGMSVAIFDYRGYGKSSGHPSENGLYHDGQAVVRYMNEILSIPSEKIVIIGTSLGGAVAAELGMKNNFRAIILESTFTSKHDMASVIFPGFPAGLFSKNQFNTLDKIGRVHSPVLIAHGTRDDMIPYPMSLKLFEAAPDPKCHYPIHDARHNDYLSVGGENYISAICRFADSLVINKII